MKALVNLQPIPILKDMKQIISQCGVVLALGQTRSDLFWSLNV
jgi:hypothetical protein